MRWVVFIPNYCCYINIDEGNNAAMQHHKNINSYPYLCHHFCKRSEYLNRSWVSINQNTNNLITETENGQKSFCDLSDFKNYSATCDQQPPIKLINYFDNSSKIPVAYSNACSCDKSERSGFGNQQIAICITSMHWTSATC